MGIYDRDYYRNDSRSVFSGFSTRTRVCTTLIIINVVVLIIQALTLDRVIPGVAPYPGWFTDTYALDVNRVSHGEVWRLLTHAFLHSMEIWHILFNMLFLFWFGSALEDIYGSKEFLAFYLVAALIAGIGYYVTSILGASPGGVALGASGAVTAVMVVFAMHYPHHTVLLIIIPIPIWLLVAINIGKDLLGMIGASKEPIAFAAHLTGAAFGFMYYRFHWRVLNWIPSFGSATTAKPRKSKLKVFREDVDEVETVAAPTTPAQKTADSDVDEQLEAQLDRVLEKVAKHGQSSLTEGEREILFRASEIYKKRRK